MATLVKSWLGRVHPINISHKSNTPHEQETEIESERGKIRDSWREPRHTLGTEIHSEWERDKCRQSDLYLILWGHKKQSFCHLAPDPNTNPKPEPDQTAAGSHAHKMWPSPAGAESRQLKGSNAAVKRILWALWAWLSELHELAAYWLLIAVLSRPARGRGPGVQAGAEAGSFSFPQVTGKRSKNVLQISVSHN